MPFAPCYALCPLAPIYAPSCEHLTRGFSFAAVDPGKPTALVFFHCLASRNSPSSFARLSSFVAHCPRAPVICRFIPYVATLFRPSTPARQPRDWGLRRNMPCVTNSLTYGALSFSFFAFALFCPPGVAP